MSSWTKLEWLMYTLLLIIMAVILVAANVYQEMLLEPTDGPPTSSYPLENETSLLPTTGGWIL